MADDPYQLAAKGKLKLKGDAGIKKKKKKKKEKNREKFEEAARTVIKDAETPMVKKTDAEVAFKKMQEKNQSKRILDKATMTHKERVEKFNQHLDGLTEHFDIPKVSWTK